MIPLIIDLDTATEQEIFDIVVRGLRAQGFVQSVEREFTCLFRDKENRYCAAGQLLDHSKLTEEFYSSYLNSQSWNKLVADGLVPESHSEFIYDLQLIHDGAPEPQEMEKQLRQFSNQFGYIFPE